MSAIRYESNYLLSSLNKMILQNAVNLEKG